MIDTQSVLADTASEATSKKYGPAPTIRVDARPHLSKHTSHDHPWSPACRSAIHADADKSQASIAWPATD
jgi:hypothetical protein